MKHANELRVSELAAMAENLRDSGFSDDDELMLAIMNEWRIAMKVYTA